ncbi:MAG: hypothetical protein ACL93V_00145 [Candidatus Electrothrix sp. YB6]
MNNKETKKCLVAELKNKIYYAEKSRDYYEKINRGLYVRNSMYVENLKETLKQLEKS